VTQDPRTKEPRPPYEDRRQQPPGLESEMRQKPDHGEQTYVGRGLLKNKVALITGGDSGIGRAVAIAYAREGADIALCFLEKEAQDAAETVRWIAKAGRKALQLPGDLADPGFCREIVSRTTNEFGRIDVLVNNSAFQPVNEELDDLKSEDLERAFAVNVFASIHLAQACAPHMKPGSAIVNTTSVQSKVASKAFVIYASTKGAINSMTLALSNLLAPKGIRVNCVAPGPIWTPIQPSSKTEKQLAELGKNTPLGRAGQPAELAGAFVLLASSEGSYMTGALVPVTGGMPML
jgi:NAD(P)-dependent dehydrogenase (short-subunit alcohol dehydrogenase family)